MDEIAILLEQRLGEHSTSKTLYKSQNHESAFLTWTMWLVGCAYYNNLFQCFDSSTVTLNQNNESILCVSTIRIYNTNRHISHQPPGADKKWTYMDSPTMTIWTHQ